MDNGDVEGFAITERFSIGCGMWGTAFLAGGVVAVISLSPEEGRPELAEALGIVLFGATLIAWELIRRFRRVTLHVRGEEIEVFRRAARVASATRADIEPWPQIKQTSDKVRGGIFSFLVVLPGLGITAVAIARADTGPLLIGASILALGLGNLACVIYTLAWHWSVDLWIGKNSTLTNPMMLTFRREDVRRLLLAGQAMPWRGK